MMSIVATLPMECRHCGYEIERAADGVWVDVRFGEDEEADYCAMSAYGSHLPEN